MSRVLAPPPISGDWAATRGPWSGPERRPQSAPWARREPSGFLEVLQVSADRAWRCSLDDFEAWSVDHADPEIRHQLEHHWPELPHRTDMHRRYATRRRSRRPTRRNR